MARRSEFVDYLLELYADWGGVSARGMFGGFGLFRDGMMFGLVADDVLYLKVDKHNRPAFDAEELEPFTYLKGDKPFAMSYCRCPETALENPDELIEWTRPALDAAFRAKKK